MLRQVSYGTSTPTLRWNSLRTELLWIYDGPVRAESLCVTKDHGIGYWMWLLRKGNVVISAEKQTLKAKAGQWLVSPHGMTRQEFSPDADILSVHFQCTWPTGENLFVEKEGLVFDASRFPRLERSASRLERLVSRHFPGVRLELIRQPTGYPVFLRIQQRFQEWLINFFEAMTEQNRTLPRGGECDERLWRAAECLHSAPLDGPFPAQQLQRETLLGRAQIDRLFWKAFGATTREYWENVRQESAESSLKATLMSIKEISYRLGFKQPSHFTKWFFRRVGATPQEYRKRAGNEEL